MLSGEQITGLDQQSLHLAYAVVALIAGLLLIFNAFTGKQVGIVLVLVGGISLVLTAYKWWSASHPQGSMKQ